MKEHLIKALDEAYTTLENVVPKTKKKEILVGIEDVEPLNLIQFMKDNEIPDNATFGGRDNGYDGYSEVCLCYEIDVPMTEKERLKIKTRRFNDYVFHNVYNILTSIGYVRIPLKTEFLKEFKDTCVYNMYINKEFDRIEKYYSYFFVKPA